MLKRLKPSLKAGWSQSRWCGIRRVGDGMFFTVRPAGGTQDANAAKGVFVDESMENNNKLCVVCVSAVNSVLRKKVEGSSDLG